MSYSVGSYFENFIQEQVKNGRFNNASEVIREGLRLVEEKERQLEALKREIQIGIEDIEAGRITKIEDLK